MSFEYGVQVPGGDLDERFGTNSRIGTHLEAILTNSKFLFGGETSFIFGTDVKEDVLANLRTSDGEIIGNNRTFGDVLTRQRGMQLNAYLGKIFQLGKGKSLSGIKVTGGLGLLQHKIRIQDDSRTIAQLTGDYIKGYDRLTNGLSFNFFLGYQYLGSNRRINFLLGIDMTIANTQSRRDFDFATMMKDEQKRKDSLIGLKAGWILPIGSGRTAEEIIY